MADDERRDVFTHPGLCACGPHRRCPTSAATSRPLRCRSSRCSPLMVRLPMWGSSTLHAGCPTCCSASWWARLLGVRSRRCMKDQASPTFKKTFGFHPLGCGATTSKSSWRPCLRTGRAGSNTAADHIAVMTRSRRSPPRTARRCSSAPTAPGHPMTCSTGSPSRGQGPRPQCGVQRWVRHHREDPRGHRAGPEEEQMRTEISAKFRLDRVRDELCRGWPHHRPLVDRPGRRLRAHPRRSWALTLNAPVTLLGRGCA